MIKRIKSHQLRPGMYVHKLECKWSNHPFMFSHFKLKSEKDLSKIKKAGIQFVQIDTKKGMDLTAQKPPTANKEVTFDEELKEAAMIADEAKTRITDIMENVKLGQHVNVEAASAVVSKMTDSVFRNQNALSCLGQIRSKDTYLFEHSVNLGVLIAVFGKFKGYSKALLDPVVLGAFVHDIGKIKVPDEILHKPGKLTKEEFEHMKKHVVYTEELLEEADGISEAARQIASEHHEKMNGQGYSRGLLGDEISLYGKMAGIVDVYDALTSSRCYHEGRPPSEVLKMMTDWGGAHFDTQLLHEFIRCMGVFPVGSFVELTDGHLALVLENVKNPLRPYIRVIMNKKTRKELSPVDVHLVESDLRIVDFVDPKEYDVNIGNYLDL